MFRSKSLFCVSVIAGVLSFTPTTLRGTHQSPRAALTAVSEQDSPPAEAFRVLPAPGVEGPEITPYLLYQTSLAWQQDELRKSRWSRIKSEGDLLRLRAELRHSILEMIGGLPSEKTDLHPMITGTITADGFHVEKLIYQSIPGLYVTALVYVPENGVKVHPVVLVAAGHSPKGKIYYQDLCERLVRRGYLVLSWDPIGQGERSQFWNAAEKKSRYNMICGEHAVLGNLAYLAGASLARWEIWDGMRAVDYLLTRGDVDSHRLSLTGTSGGGFQAALLGALDERIKVIIPSCYITALPMRVANRVFVDPDSDPEQDLFGLMSQHVDHPGLLLMMYPRAVMVATVALDFFPVEGSEKTYSEVRSFYERFGHADRMGFAESYNKHQYSLKNQASALEFLDRFNGMPLQHGLPSVAPIGEEVLRVTRSGQVLSDYQDARSLTYFIAEYAAHVPPDKRDTLTNMYQRLQDPLISSWTVSQYKGSVSSHELRWETAGTSSLGTTRIDRFVLHHSTNLEMPLLHLYSEGNSPRGAILWLSLDGKARAKDWPQIKQLLGEGYEVYSFDFRGLGETRMNYRALSSDAPALEKNDPEQAYTSPLCSVLADYVYNSLLTGRPYFLQLMDDINIAQLFIRSQESRSHEAHRSVTIATSGYAYSLAVRYKELNPNVMLLPTKSSPLLDWSALVEQRQEQWPIAFLLPGGALLREDKLKPHS